MLAAMVWIDTILGLLWLLGLGLVIAVAAASAYTARMLTRPPRHGYGYAVARSLPGDPGELPTPRTFEAFTIRSHGAELHAWSITGDKPAGPTIIYTHGWGESRVIALPRLDALARFAARIVAWDLPGHGESEGRCTLGVHEPADLQALVDALPNGDAGHRVVLMGFSLGAGVSIAAASAGCRCDLVIAEAPYRLPRTPARNMLRALGMPSAVNLPIALRLLGPIIRAPARWRTPDGAFDRASLAQRVSVPVLVIHGEHDTISPIADGRAIAGAAPHGTLITLEGADHLTAWRDDTTRALMLNHVATAVAV